MRLAPWGLLDWREADAVARWARRGVLPSLSFLAAAAQRLVDAGLSLGGHARVGVAALPASANTADCAHNTTGYTLVLAADVLFGVGDIEPIARAVAALLAPVPEARFVIARSSWFEDLQPTLVAHMEGVGLALASESTDREEGATVLEFAWQ